MSEKEWVEARQWAGGRTSKKYRLPKETAARWHSPWEHREACLAVLPAQDGALLDRAVPQLD